MTPLAILRIAAKALAANAFRSVLTVLSITLGAFAIVLMSSLAEGGLKTLKRGLEDLGGARLLFVVPKTPERAEAKRSSYGTGFSREDGDELLEGLPHLAERTMYASIGRRDATSDAGRTARTDLVAADARFLDVYRMRIGHGRLLSDDDDQQHAQVCVVGNELAAKIWSDEPVGRMLSVGGLRCRVVGVLADNRRFGVRFGFDWNDLVVAPLESVADVDADVHPSAILVAKTDDPASNDPVKRILNARLVERRHGIDDFTLYDFSRILEKFNALFAVMEAIVGLIAGVALFIGGVGVMNMMLVSVSERVREIGIRKALGARRSDIAAQFFGEALLLSSSGGVLGAAAGGLFAFLASLVIRRGMPTWVGGISGGAVVAALVVSLGIGAVFGLLPARRAAALDPIEAMRR